MEIFMMKDAYTAPMNLKRGYKSKQNGMLSKGPVDLDMWYHPHSPKQFTLIQQLPFCPARVYTSHYTQGP